MSENDLISMGNSIKSLKHRSFQRLLDYKLEGDLIYNFWEYPEGGLLKDRLFEIGESKSNIQKELRGLDDPEVQFDSIQIQSISSNIHMKMSEKSVLDIYLQIAESVSYLHDNSVAHGNIGISSVFFDEQNFVKLGNLSIKTNLELRKSMQNIYKLEENAANVRKINAMKKYLLIDIRALQRLIWRVALGNLREKSIEECYTAPFRSFILMCHQDKFKNAAQLIGMVYIYIM